MTLLIVLAAYLAGLVYTARKVAWWMLNDGFDDDIADQVMVRVMGFLAGIFWPLAVFVALITGRLPKTDREIRDELTIRDARIAELERELGITGREASRG